MAARHEHPQDQAHEGAPPPLIRVRGSNDSLSQAGGHDNREVIMEEADDRSVASIQSLQDDEAGAFLHRRARALPRRHGIIIQDGEIQPIIVEYRQAAPAGAPPAAAAAFRRRPVHTPEMDRATSFGILLLCAALFVLLVVTVLILGAIHAELQAQTAVLQGIQQDAPKALKLSLRGVLARAL